MRGDPGHRDRGARQPRRRADADAGEPQEDRPADPRMAGRRGDLARAPTTTTPTTATPAILVQDAAFMVIVPSFCPGCRRARGRTRSSSTARTASRSRTRSSPTWSCRIDAVIEQEGRLHRRAGVAVLRVEPLALRLPRRGAEGGSGPSGWNQGLASGAGTPRSADRFRAQAGRGASARSGARRSSTPRRSSCASTAASRRPRS